MIKRKLLTTSAAILCLLSTVFATEQNHQQIIQQISTDLKFFSNNLATKISENTTLDSINKINHPQLKAVAKSLLDGTYNNQYRLTSFNAILNTKTLGKQLHIGDGYSNFENLTGIYLPLGKH
ncbi:MAG: hypothetical protein ACRC37_02915, partial [Lentisphaeria bacterium]